MTREPSPVALYVAAQLEQAGATMLAMRSPTGPAGYGSGWPDVVRDAVEAYGYTPDRVRTPVPSAAAITRMDRAFAWIGLIPARSVVIRRIVGARAMVHPMTGRHLASWRKIGRLLGADPRAVMRWHRIGIEAIAEAVEQRGDVTHDIAIEWLDAEGYAHPREQIDAAA